MTALGVQPIEKSGRPREGEKEASSTAPYAGERERERERGQGGEVRRGEGRGDKNVQHLWYNVCNVNIISDGECLRLFEGGN